MNKLLVSLSIITTLLLLNACSSPTEPTHSQVDIIGTITEISLNSGQLEILVEEDATVFGPDKKNGDKIYLSITNETEIYKKSNSELVKIKSGFLEAGMKVKGWTSGFILESYPPQAGAEQIIVVENE